ncbi:hypothetical protein ABZ725_48760, partial [Streptomyces sp. NPDC006872]|uniref:hypothetical protein n=1 Tax=Streptomyces sp. NPDC006872 TaxID=3155720 RepID=UPI003404BD57
MNLQSAVGVKHRTTARIGTSCSVQVTLVEVADEDEHAVDDFHLLGDGGHRLRGRFHLIYCGVSMFLPSGDLVLVGLSGWWCMP